MTEKKKVVVPDPKVAKFLNMANQPKPIQDTLLPPDERTPQPYVPEAMRGHIRAIKKETAADKLTALLNTYFDEAVAHGDTSGCIEVSLDYLAQQLECSTSAIYKAKPFVPFRFIGKAGSTKVFRK
jgi:hypothetical protein